MTFTSHAITCPHPITGGCLLVDIIPGSTHTCHPAADCGANGVPSDEINHTGTESPGGAALNNVDVKFV